MMSVADMKALLRARGKDVEAYLATCLDGRDVPQRLKDSMLYSLQAGGKRLRPVLCLSTAALCGLSPQRSMPFAAAIEMIHTYSLIHDDLPAMDDDDFRPQRSCFQGQGGDVAGRHMGKFDAADYRHSMGSAQSPGDSGNTGNDEIDVRRITVVRQCDGAIPRHLGPTHQFRRNQFAVTEDTMGMEIDHFGFPFTSCRPFNRFMTGGQ